MSAGRVRKHRGMTLIELLMVVAIASVLLALTAGSLRFSLADRKIREASRIINAYMARAKARAAETGVPVGVVFERADVPLLDDATSPGLPTFNYSRRLFITETPPPYAGDFSDTRGLVATAINPTPPQILAAMGPGRLFTMDVVPAAAALLPIIVNDPPGVLPTDDVVTAYRIKFDFRGEEFWICKLAGQPVVMSMPGPPPTYRLTFFVPVGSNSIWNSTGFVAASNVPFQIRRPPAVGAIPPIDLPTGVVVDLANSGIGLLGRQFGRADRQALVVMFSPDGRVESINYRGAFDAPQGTIYLMLGERDLFDVDPSSPLPLSDVDATPVSFSKNTTKLSNLWVAVGHMTGNVNVQDNTWHLRGVSATPTMPPYYFIPSSAEGRSEALEMKSKGAN